MMHFVRKLQNERKAQKSGLRKGARSTNAAVSKVQAWTRQKFLGLGEWLNLTLAKFHGTTKY